jgi:antitoxin component of MazEF toxin-antitoxin module
MIECDSTARRWGNSLGITLPKEDVDREGIQENDRLKVLVMKNDNTFKETFGLLKGRFKQSTQEIKDELRKELYDD